MSRSFNHTNLSILPCSYHHTTIWPNSPASHPRSLARSLTDRLITAQDHASIQIQIADVDADGKAIKGQATTIAICGKIRAQGDSDDSINRIATKEGLLKNVWSYSR
nr:uncharacterized protein CI109_000249 [Kwoniella shandongensis]KAA5531408.1 hypothetical protein CI109_000249 [Kwoniella shandongensis]